MEGRILSRRNMTPQKILVFGNRLLGDSVDSLPAVKSLALGYPAASIHLLAPSYAHAIYGALGCFSEFHAMDVGTGLRARKGLSLWQRLHLIRRLRAQRFDLAFILPGGFGHAVLARVLGIPVRVGHPSDGRAFLLTHPAPLSPLRPNFENFNALLGALPEPVAQRSFALPVEGESGFAAGSYFAVSPCSSEAHRAWRAERFVALCLEVTNRTGWRPVFLGLAEERAYIETIRVKTGGTNLAGERKLPGLFPVLRDARFFLGAISGLAHLAGAIGVPSVILYGPSNPTLARPLGPQVIAVFQGASGIDHAARTRRENRARFDINAISPEEVLSRMEELPFFPVSGGRPTLPESTV
jgi:heptosyltransferase-2